MLKKGDKIPSISVSDQDGNQINMLDYKSKLVVFFYPKASTPGCTAEACSLNENISSLEARGYQVIGISADSVARQKKFSEKYSFTYPLLADEEKQLINAFGVWGPKKFMGKEYEGILRTTFLVDENGVVEEVIEKVKTKGHAQQVLAI